MNNPSIVCDYYGRVPAHKPMVSLSTILNDRITIVSVHCEPIVCDHYSGVRQYFRGQTEYKLETVNGYEIRLDGDGKT